MWSRDLFSKTGSRVALLVGQFIALILCIAFIRHVYITDILPDKEAKETFEETNCFLVSKKLSTRGHLFHTYRADFLVSYNVKGVQYHHWVSGNGLDLSFTRNEVSQEDVLSQFDVGGTYTCYFNPENPQTVILVLRHNWLSTFPLIMPSVVFIAILYFFFKNVLRLLSEMRKKNERKSKKQS